MGLKNKGLVLYFMILLGLIGIVSYSKLSQSEDPPFTFKVMVIQTYWPGASAKEVSLQVTDRIEKELMTTGQYDRIMAYSRPGESMVTFVAKDSLASKDVADVWYNVRKKVGDIRHELPQGVQVRSLMMNSAIPLAIFMCSRVKILTMRPSRNTPTAYSCNCNGSKMLPKLS